MAAYKVSDHGKEIDYQFAESLSQNKPRQALPKLAETLVEGEFAKSMIHPLLWLFGPVLLGRSFTEIFRRDVLIEAKAEVNHDGTESLKRIKIPVLVLGGENDPYFTVESFKNTADLIPNAVLKLYPGKRHNLLDDPQVAKDILAWAFEGK